jgi:hypothetical protein
MPTPTIPAGNLYMNATLYTGNGSTQTITNGAAGQAFQPDLVWIKQRNGTRKQNWYDSVRGVGKELYSNNTDAETAAPDSLTAFNSNGFNLGNDGGSNVNAGTFVGWNWKAGGTAVSNTSGTITSSVSANTTSGFSVVAWTGNGVTAATVGHGLGAVPAMIICKERSASGEYWHVKHQSTASNTNLFLNVTNASTSAASVGDGVLADLSSSTTFGFATAGSPGNVVAVNENGVTNIAYCWSQVAGYSAFGSYTGNGSADGSFVYLGFRPRFVMVKNTSTGGAGLDWFIYDTSRDTYNASTKELEANLSAVEDDYALQMDILSNGFKWRASGAGGNGSGNTYVYACWAENPFKYSNAR